MSGPDEDDKPTVVLDLNALKKLKMKQEEDLANMASELEFNIPPEEDVSAPLASGKESSPPKNLSVILFDFGSDFFHQSQSQFPKGFQYKIIKTLPELNDCLKVKSFQIVVFNYDVNPKAVNQLCAQIKAKMPTTKTMIMAKAISPEKAKIHAQTPSGAAGYYQFPLDSGKIEKEFLKIHQQVKKV
jgi:hypothetical protein